MNPFNTKLYVAMFKDGVAPFIRNVQTKIAIWEAGGHPFPVSVNDAEWENCYVCSPYTHYVSYASEECGKLGNKLIRDALRLMLGGLGQWLKRAELNRCVHINNFLLSTNLYPDWDGTGVVDLHERALGEHPGHTIIFRSLNRLQNTPLILALLRLGYWLLPTRRVWLVDGREKGNITRHRDFKNDERIRLRSGLRYMAHDEFQDHDLARAGELYNLLYLDKYSLHNPQFTVDYLRYCHRHHLFHFHGLRDTDGQLCGVTGGFMRGRAITTPILGYDTTQPQERGLYRILTNIVMRETAENGWMMNLSAGAGQFKRSRGGCPEIEYSAVYDQHLASYRQRPWHVLRWISQRCAIPLMEEYDL